MKVKKEPIYINIVFEDLLSEAVIKKMLQTSETSFEISSSLDGHGNGYIKRNINGFNNASRVNPYFVLTDCDTYECPISLMTDYLSFPKNQNMIFRIAVKEVESWILADREGFSHFLGIDINKISTNCDSIPDPKIALISLAKLSKNKYLKKGIVPSPKTTAKQGLYYNNCLIPFVKDHWNINNACVYSHSLRKAMKALDEFNPI